jgi:hypothetical protein
MMPTYYQFAFSSPVEGFESEYDRWYSEDHLRHTVALSVVSAGQRFKRVSGTPWPTGRHENLVVWELAGDPTAAIETLLANHDTDAMPISPAIDMASVQPPTMELVRRVVGSVEQEFVNASRGPLFLAFLNAAESEEGSEAALEAHMLDDALLQFAALPDVGAASFWKLTEAQLRGSARKYRYLLMLEAQDEKTLLESLVAGGDRLTVISHTDPERMFAALFTPLTQRVSTQVTG